SIEFIVYPELNLDKEPNQLCVVGDLAQSIAKSYSIKSCENFENTDVTLISDLSKDTLSNLNKFFEEDNSVMLIFPEDESVNINIENIDIATKKCPEVFFAASPKSLQKYHFNMLYN